MTNYTPIPAGSPANANIFNLPLEQLSGVIGATALPTIAQTLKGAIAEEHGDTALVAVTAAAVTAEVVSARGGYGDLNSRLAMLAAAGGNISTAVNGVHNAGWTEVVVDSSTGFIAASYVVYALVGGGLEYNLVADIHSPTQLTLTTPIGTGGIADNAIVAMISASEYAAATVIPHGGAYVPTLPATMAIASQGVYNVLAYGSAAEAPFLAAIAAIDTDKVTLLISAGVTVAADLTVPTTLTLKIAQGGAITVNNGITLTIGEPDAGLYQIFNCIGTGKVVIPSATLHPEWWGAVGDGAIDDSSAMAKLIEAISGGAVINYSSGKTYIFSNTTYVASKFTSLSNVVINGNGATLKVKDDTTLLLGYGLVFSGCSDIVVNNLVLDGNRANYQSVLGESDGMSIGINICDGTTRVKLDTLNVYDFATDSAHIGIGPDINARPSHIEISNCRLYRARRNNISLVSATDVTISNCQILSAGVTVGASVGTLPMVGCDLEPNYVMNAGVICANERIRLINNYWSGNVVGQLLTSLNVQNDIFISGNIFDITCGIGINLFGATAKDALLRVQITDNIFRVSSLGLCAILSIQSNLIMDVLINNNQFYSSTWNFPYALVQITEATKQRWVIANNTFTSPYQMLHANIGINDTDLLVSGNKYLSTGDDLSANDWVVYIESAIINNETFTRPSSMRKVAFTSGSELPSEGNSLVGATSGSYAFFDRLTVTSGTWGAGDAAGMLYIYDQSGVFQAENLNILGGTANVMTIGGDTSAISEIHEYLLGANTIVNNVIASDAKTKIHDIPINITLPGSLISKTGPGLLEYYGTAAPGGGTWAVGAIVRNTVPTTGGSMGWVCTTAGTPGTWKAFGAIA